MKLAQCFCLHPDSASDDYDTEEGEYREDSPDVDAMFRRGQASDEPGAH